MKTKYPLFEFYQAKKGRGKGLWRWRITARNGKIICASTEGFVKQNQAFRNAHKTMWHLHEGLMDCFEVV